jgi:hypothetical protein
MLATRRAGPVREPYGSAGSPVPRHELQRLLDESGLPTHVADVAWSARVRLQHRIASRFSRGPLFIAGDAAHVHSPAGAQGMNAGIHDAVNLGWKLAFAAGAARRTPATGAARRTAAAEPGSALLDSYAAERRPADVAVLRLTRAMVRTRAQFRLNYRSSALSTDVRASLVPVRGGLARRGLRPGSRVADTLVRCEGRRVRAHELMATPGVHIFLQADARAMPERLIGPFVHVHRLDDRPGTGMLVVRPDGYAAVRAPVLDERHLEAWLRMVGLIGG